MRADLVLLCFAYVLSQFFRAFLAVLSQILEADIGTTSEDLAFASGLWFLVFAAMQIPVGAALDRVGPRKTSSVLLLIGGGGGALLFAFATTPMHINIAMALIGVGCSPVLMASYYIFARSFPTTQFATLAAIMLGVGSLGNLVASYPMALAADLIGWRLSLIGLAAISAVTAVGLFIMVMDPPAAETEQRGSVFDLLKIPAMWLILPLVMVNYMPAAGIRGLWIGPYMNDIFDASTSFVGQASLIMGVAMIVGTLFYGPLDRILGTRKWIAFAGNLCGGLSCFALAYWTEASVWLSIMLFAMVGFFGATFPVLIAHGRSFFPEHLTGRGVTLLNLFAIGGVGIMQLTSGPLQRHYSEVSQAHGYSVLFAFFGALIVFGLALYAFSEDRTG